MSHVFSNLCYHMGQFVRWGRGGCLGEGNIGGGRRELCNCRGANVWKVGGGENFGLPIYLNNNSIYLICLICLSSAGMQKLLNVCSKYAT